MANRFMLSTTELSPESERNLVRAFDTRKFEWWHWLPNTWILITEAEFRVGMVRDILQLVDDQAECVVVQLPNKLNWASAFEETKSFREWYQENWDKIK